MLQKLLHGHSWELAMNDEGEMFLQLSCGRVVHTTHLSRSGQSDWFYREMFEFAAFVKRENDNMLSSLTKQNDNMLSNENEGE